MLKKIISSFSAGLLITIGGTVYLACENRYIASVMFSVALLCICLKGYSLYTGSVGFIPQRHGRSEFSSLALCLLGNTIGTVLGGWLIRAGLPDLGAAAETLCGSKLLQLPLQTFVRALFCGILMYLAVSIYRERNNVIGVIFCIPVFILSGFEHSIADIFYFAASGIVEFKAFIFIWIVILGNSAGAMLLPALNMIGGKDNG